MSKSVSESPFGTADFWSQKDESPSYRQKGLSRIADFGLTVEQCLTIAPLNQGEIFAGHAGLDRAMSWVHVVDHRDMEDSLAHNELLLTSGIALAGDEELQHEIFEIMHRRNSAGLVVALGVYVAELPERMLQQADRLSIPLIGIPWAVNFGDITRSLLTRLVEANYHFMESSQRLNRELLDVVLRRGDLKTVCQRMERTLGCAVHIYNEALQPVAEGDAREARGEALDASKIRAALAGVLQLPSSEAARTRTILSGDRTVGIAVPINVGARHRGWLVLDSQDRSNDRIFALTGEVGATIAALIITHEDEIERIAQRQNDGRLYDVLDGKLLAHSDAVSELGLKSGEPVTVAIIDITVGDTNDALGIARNTLKKFVEVHVMAARGRSLVGLVQRPRGRQSNWPQKLADALAEGGYMPRLAHGASLTNHADIAADYTTVRDTLRLAHVLRPDETVVRTEQMTVLSLAMRNLGSATSLAQVCPSILKLQEHDRSLHGSLVAALGCLLDVDGNVSLAARKLGIHRHTMLYRMNRISEILNVELNAATRLELRLQLIAWQMSGR
jgi:purine catabolism regulator